ncbi:MAG: hypothetical protein ACYC6R_15020, partial [Anaerolineales bacterium]
SGRKNQRAQFYCVEIAFWLYFVRAKSGFSTISLGVYTTITFFKITGRVIHRWVAAVARG